MVVLLSFSRIKDVAPRQHKMLLLYMTQPLLEMELLALVHLEMQTGHFPKDTRILYEKMLLDQKTKVPL